MERPRELILACAEMQSAVNLATIVRSAGNAGVSRVIFCGRPKLDRNITREAIDHVVVEERRSLGPVLERLRGEGYQIVALEQTEGSESLYELVFARRTVIVVGNERSGL